MQTRRGVAALVLTVAATGCDDTTGTGGAGGQSGGTTGASTTTASMTSSSVSGSASVTTTTGSMSTGASTSTGMSGPPTPAQLLALTTTCDVASASKYATDEGEANTVDVCALSGAFFWKSDFDVDCDGKMSAQCNANTDPSYYPATSAEDSQGDPLDAASLPFIVIPLASAKFDYDAENIHLGAVAAVIYQDKLVYAVFGDQGPNGIIGEGSYALAQALGIDPDPAIGGSDGPVTFIVFTGTNAVVSPIEDHPAATSLGETLATKLIQDNP